MYIFDVDDDNGALEFKLQHASDNSTYDNTTYGTIVVIALGTKDNKYQLSNDIKSISTGVAVPAASAWGAVSGLTTAAISLPVSGSILVTTSINNQLTGGNNETGEWKLQQRKGLNGTWTDIGLPISRSIGSPGDYGIASLGLVVTDLPKDDYYFQLLHKGDDTDVETLNTTLVAVALAYNDATNGGRAFPAFNTEVASASTASNTLTPALSQVGSPASNTDMYFYAQYNMQANAALDAPTFDMSCTGTSVAYSSQDQQRTLSSDTDVGAGASVGLATGLLKDASYTASVNHKSDGTISLTTSNIILSGFQTNDQPSEGYWIGGASGNETQWNNTANWADGTIPISTTNVTLFDKTYDPVIGVAANCKNLVIASGSVTISPDYSLTVAEEIINDAGNSGLVIQSTTDGDGSLIFASGTPAATVQRYLTDDMWHLVTPSTTGVTVADFNWGDIPESWILSHDESKLGDLSWTYETNLSTALNVGQGYMAWLDLNTKQDATATMTGNLQSADLSPPITYAVDGLHGQNLVGNPFTCAIDWDDGSWVKTNLELTVWVWDNSKGGIGDYRVWNGEGDLTDGVIPMGQGFFVRSILGSPILTIPADARSHNTQAFYKDQKTFPVLRLQLSNGSFGNTAWVLFHENASQVFDNGYDASKMFGSQEATQMYFEEEGQELCIVAKPLLQNNVTSTIPLFLLPAANGLHQLEITDINNFEDITIHLEDLKTSVLYELSSNIGYDFEAEIGDDPARFQLHFLYSPDGISESEIIHNNDIQIYAYDSKIYIRSKGKALQKEGQVQIYDLLGRVVHEQKIGTDELVSIPVNTQQTCLIVKVRKGNAVKSTKIIF